MFQSDSSPPLQASALSNSRRTAAGETNSESSSGYAGLEFSRLAFNPRPGSVPVRPRETHLRRIPYYS
ncbi:hypothetical protein RB213_011659 [Colletotrichum asianum]